MSYPQTSIEKNKIIFDHPHLLLANAKWNNRQSKLLGKYVTLFFHFFWSFIVANFSSKPSYVSAREVKRNTWHRFHHRFDSGGQQRPRVCCVPYAIGIYIACALSRTMPRNNQLINWFIQLLTTNKFRSEENEGKNFGIAVASVR